MTKHLLKSIVATALLMVLIPGNTLAACTEVRLANGTYVTRCENTNTGRICKIYWDSTGTRIDPFNGQSTMRTRRPLWTQNQFKCPIKRFTGLRCVERAKQYRIEQKSEQIPFRTVVALLRLRGLSQGLSRWPCNKC
jgi:hypothetical protein